MGDKADYLIRESEMKDEEFLKRRHPFWYFKEQMAKRNWNDYGPETETDWQNALASLKCYNASRKNLHSMCRGTELEGRPPYAPLVWLEEDLDDVADGDEVVRDVDRKRQADRRRAAEI